MAVSIDALLYNLQQRMTMVIIILHNFDELIPGKASGYDKPFFEALNGIASRNDLSLLCVSTDLASAGPLDIQPLRLPRLTQDEVIAELSRRRPADEAIRWPALASWITTQPAPYTVLEDSEPFHHAILSNDQS